jgi:hypothetical protein
VLRSLTNTAGAGAAENNLNSGTRAASAKKRVAESPACSVRRVQPRLARGEQAPAGASHSRPSSPDFSALFASASRSRRLAVRHPAWVASACACSSARGGEYALTRACASVRACSFRTSAVSLAPQEGESADAPVPPYDLSLDPSGDSIAHIDCAEATELPPGVSSSALSFEKFIG